MTKWYLRQYQKIFKEIQQVNDRMKETRSLLESPKAQQITGMPFNAPAVGDQMAEAVCRYIELQAKHDALLVRLLETALTIETVIETLDDSTERQLLRARYLQGLPWEDVAETINYSLAQTHKFHGAALLKLAKEGNENATEKR